MKLFINIDSDLVKGPRQGNTGPKLPQKAPSQPKSFGAPKQQQPKAQMAPSQKAPTPKGGIAKAPSPTPTTPTGANPAKPEGEGLGEGFVPWRRPGDPPPGSGWRQYTTKDGEQGWKKPVGEATPEDLAQAGKGGDKGEGSPDQGQAQQPQEQVEPPKPEHVSDPLTNDDGTKVGEESLDNRDDGMEADPWEEERAPYETPPTPEEQADLDKTGALLDKFESAQAQKDKEFDSKLNSTFDKLDQAVSRQKTKEGNKRKLSELGDLSQRNASRNAERAQGKKEVEEILNEMKPAELHKQRAQEVLNDLSGRSKPGVPPLSAKLKDEVEQKQNPFLLTRKKEADALLLTRKKQVEAQQAETAVSEAEVAANGAKADEVREESIKQADTKKVTADDIKAAKDKKSEVEGLANEHSSKEEKFKQASEKHKQHLADLDKKVKSKKNEIKTLQKHESTVQASKRKTSAAEEAHKSVVEKHKKAKKDGEAKISEHEKKVKDAEAKVEAAKKEGKPGKVDSAKAAHKAATEKLKKVQSQHADKMSEHDKKVKTSSKKLEDARAEHKKHRDKLSKNKTKIDSLKADISKHGKEKKKAEQDHSQREKELNESKSSLESARGEVDDKKSSLDLPDSDDQKLDHAQHTGQAKDMLDKIDSHLKRDPDNEQLKQLRSIYQEQSGIEHMPTKEDRQAMSRANSYAKNSGFHRHTDEIDAENQQKEQKRAEAQQKVDDAEAHASAKEAEAADKAQMATDKQNTSIAEDQKKQGITPSGDETVATEERQHTQNSRRGSSLMSQVNAGSSVGDKLSRFSSDAEAGDEVTDAMISVGTKGPAKLLDSSNKKKEADEKEKNADDKAKTGQAEKAKKEAEKEAAKVQKETAKQVDKASREAKQARDKADKAKKKHQSEAQKGMRLYLDLNKAIGPRPNVAINSDKTEEQKEEEYDDSFDRGTAGASGGDPVNRPGNGRKMNQKDGEDGVAKSFFTWEETFSDMRKSLGSNGLHPLEEEFAKNVLGSQRSISGRKRSLFSEYACDKLQKSLSELIHKV